MEIIYSLGVHLEILKRMNAKGLRKAQVFKGARGTHPERRFNTIKIEHNVDNIHNILSRFILLCFTITENCNLSF